MTWPAPGKALLPESLRNAWAGEPLPDWLLERTGLTRPVTLGSLGPEFTARRGVPAESLVRYLLRVLQSRHRTISSLPVLTRPWPRDLRLEWIDLDTRTRNCLQKRRTLAEPDSLSRITYGDLFSIGAMGVKSVLDFAVNVEHAIGPPAIVGREVAGTTESSSGARPADQGSGAADPNLLLEAMSAEWAEMVSEEDRRFADLLPDGAGTLIQRIDTLTATASNIAEDRQVALLAAALPAVVERVETIRRLPLDLALRQYVSAQSETTGSRLDALLARLGWGDKPALTLQEAADMIGISRERIRQLQAKLADNVPSHPVLIPALDRALDCLAQAAPIAADEAANRLRAEGISGIPFHPANVLAAAELCRRAATYTLQGIKGRVCVVTDATLASSDRIVTIATRRACAAGATSVEDVVAAAAQEGIDIGAREVRELILPLAGAAFLDGDWFWMPRVRPDRNRLYNVTRAILSVVSPVDVATIREGARRKYRLREAGVVPPRSVMATLLKAQQTFSVDAAGLVSSVRPLDYRQELGTAEQIIVEVVRASPTGILDREDLARGCEARGVKPSTVGVMTCYSPILEHLGTDMWALRGTRVDPAAVEAFRQANALRPREKRISDHGWRPDGRLWLAIRVPRPPVGTIGIPSPVAQYVLGRRFAARTEEGANAGNVVVDEKGSSWGYAPFLNRAGADEGDTLVVSFDLATDEAVLALASADALEDLAG